MAQAVTGLFTSAEQARWAIEDLRAAGFTEAQIATGRPEVDAGTGVASGDAADGHMVVRVAAGERYAEAIQVMARHSAEMLQNADGGEIGDISNAPREGDGRPVMTEPLPAGVTYVRDMDAQQSERHAPGDRGNMAQTSGQFYDMVRTSSDDGTVPPTAQREAITAPPVGGVERIVTSGAGVEGSNISDVVGEPKPVVGGPQTELEKFAARDSSATEATPDLQSAQRAAQMIDPGSAARPIPQERHGR